MKRTSRVVSHSQFNLARYFALGTGAVSFFTGLFFVLANPQFSDTSRDQAIYEGGVGKDLVELTPDNRSRNIGISLMLASLVAGTIAIALSGEDDLDHPTSIQSIIPPSKTELQSGCNSLPGDRVQQAITELRVKLESQEWLCSCVQASSLVIVGGTGSGKSRLAQCVAMFQVLLNQGTLRIGDLDAHQNLERKAWIMGNVYGEKPKDAPALPEITNRQVEEIRKLYGVMVGGQRSESSPWETYIWDELVKWQQDPILLGLLQELISFGVATTRKRNQCAIYLAHGLEKGMFGGESNASGVLANLLEVSPVIYLPTRKNRWGKAIKEDFFFFKPAGTRLGKTDEPPTKANHRQWQLLNFPQQLDPSKIGEALRPLWESLGHTLETYSDRQQFLSSQATEEFTEELHDQFPGFANTAQSAATLQPDCNDEAVPISKLSEKALKLYQTRNREGRYKYATGLHSIDTVYNEWRKTGGFVGKGAKGNFITFLKNTQGIRVIENKFEFTVLAEETQNVC